MYKQKYLKYRAKYLNLKNELYFGGGLEDMPSQIITQILNRNKYFRNEALDALIFV